jgi:pimeloyl-ACP methyl ester carboxylesterase
MSDVATRSTVHLRHNKVSLALHQFEPADDSSATPLLVLHSLGGRTPDVRPSWADVWHGPVHGLDFTGHGASTVPRGGGYSAEMLLGDVDTALAHLGTATIVGFGLGAYAALLAAGGRPELVRGAVLCDGPGLAGGATHPTSVTVLPPVDGRGRVPDPWALVELAADLRPPDYATTFVRIAVERSGLDEPIIACTKSSAPWLDAVLAEPGIGRAGDVRAALQRYAGASTGS